MLTGSWTFSPSGEPYYDVAFWVVRPVTLGVYVRPVCLPGAPNPDPDAYVRDSAETMGDSMQLSSVQNLTTPFPGWGVVGRQSNKQSNVLRSTSLRIYRQRQCLVSRKYNLKQS